ncbi:MAG: DUF3570 domain-containing protein [Planctomycetes bacterium]|nr:DUF3570 domain-containing protein [Planctomycetota bacterium]
MQLSRFVWIFPLSGLLPAADQQLEVQPLPLADSDRPGDLTLKLSAYNQQDNGGIEQVDEDASVFEAVILARKQITDTGTLSLRALGDVVSAASIERAHNADWQAQQGGASGNYRVGLGGGWSEQGDQVDWRIGVQFAAEYAYLSSGANAGVTWNLPGRNTALSADLQVFMDTVDLIRFNGDEEGSEARDTYTLDLGWQQVLTPYDLLSLSLSHTEQSGFLATSYNSVFTPTSEYSEELPDSRSRTALTTRWRHSFGTDSAGEIGARYYTDDWGLSAVTLDVRYSHYLLGRRLLLEPTYRLHVQQAAKYYRESFIEPLSEYRTSDPDLGDFIGHMVGLKAGFLGGSLFGYKADWDVSLFAYDRDNGLSAFWVIIGQRVEF